MTAIATSGLDGAGIDRSRQIAPSCRSGLLVVGLVAVELWLTPGFAMAGDAIQVTNARVPASDEIGIDLPLLMTISNDAAEADAILRVRCPFANFSEKHTVDRGEGKKAGDEAYYVLKGTLTENTTDQNKKTTSQSREVALNSFPKDASPPR
jgi:hypothetical protein